jgi:hypothetical protein
LPVLASGPEMLKSITGDVSRFIREVSKKMLRNEQEGIQYETRTLDNI